ncbi:MAG TPA: hypothetical protein PK864_07415 [Syntrophorhabdaceae bacterium]|nr:hypothetical protein [Syntrophorhabdaceae bacterium]HOL05730.1 hypothetical protein [Syntrophorhabdaceae bacterium]HON85842.1 hypothetical protein [Syntrophorhabdaceae bacterium]HOT41760.1 hypothetical protein [Syntrophorhabdaceae bacterium]HPC67216.1 hypothetical protein [Syntrophorhabdaceae bacterium]
MVQYYSRIIDFFIGKDFAVPIWEVMLLVVINSICLLLGRHRLGLIVSYLFVFYWGFIINRGYFIDFLGNMTWGLYIYAISGVFMLIVTVLGFFIKGNR